MYAKIPFGMMNAGLTFQRSMDIAFSKKRDRFVVIYLDDITVFSKSDEKNLKHLQHDFQNCKLYGISLNPKKSNFAMQEGKLLGHIISKEGIKIDPTRVSAIQKNEIPRSRKEIQSFLGRVNFLKTFITNFAEIVKHITNMLKNNSETR